MNKRMRQQLIEIARSKIKNDLSHDFQHIYRVLRMAEKIAKYENADLDIIIPAALFHDIIVYKGTSKYKFEVKESADFTQKTLNAIADYPKEKIGKVVYCISVCSYSKNIKPDLLEAKILQDADLLEATGAISVMRTFASSTTMSKKSFYDSKDPFCKHRVPNDKSYPIDLFFTRLLIANKRMYTKFAKKIARRRIGFLGTFLKELNLEIKECS